jgi:hypothetical protein
MVSTNVRPLIFNHKTVFYINRVFLMFCFARLQIISKNGELLQVGRIFEPVVLFIRDEILRFQNGGKNIIKYMIC